MLAHDGDAIYDAVVVGGGAAGLAAATWIARYRRSVAVLDGGEPRNRFELGTGTWARTPSTLATSSGGPGSNSGVTRRPTSAQGGHRGPARGGRRVHRGGASGLRLRSRRLVLAIGVRDRFPEVERFFEHYGAGVFHCPACDGYEARDARVVAFGWSEDVTEFALTLLGWARRVTIVTDGRVFEGDTDCRRRLDQAGVAVLEDDAVELLGERGHLEGVPGLQILQVAAAKGATAGVACARSLRGEGGQPDAWEGRVPGLDDTTVPPA